MINDDENSEPKSCFLPVDLENTHIGKELNTLIECFTGVDSVRPYSHVSLRILIQIADILSFKNSCPFYDCLNSKSSNHVD